jgi:hypothetical protein
MGFLQGLLVVLRDAGHPGLILVLDEVETLQRVRGDVRDKAFNALRQLIDEIDSGRYPGLFLVITGTPAFYDGPSGIARLAPLAQRLATDFATDARLDYVGSMSNAAQVIATLHRGEKRLVFCDSRQLRADAVRPDAGDVAGRHGGRDAAPLPARR